MESNPCTQNVVINPNIKVEIYDSNFEVLTTYDENVTLSFSTDGNPNSATLGGSLTVQATDGIAIFNDITIDNYNENYQLKATSDTLSTESSRFAIFPAKPIFRSIGVGNTSNLAPSGGDLVISGATATFSGTVPSKVGIGDVIEYGTDLAFIHGRVDSNIFQVRSEVGNNPTAANTSSWAIYRAYNKLLDAKAGAPRNISIVNTFDDWSGDKDITSTIGSDMVWNLACYGDGSSDGKDTTHVDVGGWVTGPLNYLKIFTPRYLSEVGITQRHGGIWNSNKYIIEITDDGTVEYSSALRIMEDYVRIDGLQVRYINYDGPLAADENSGSAVTMFSPTLGTAVEFYFSNNILTTTTQDLDNDNTVSGLFLGHNDINVTYYVWNNIIYDFNLEWGSTGIYADGDSFIFNNTIYNTHIGIREIGGTIVAKNNIVQATITPYNGTFDITSTNNISNNATVPNPANDFTSITLNFNDIISKDFHLEVTDTDAIDSAVDLSNTAPIYLFLNIDGDPRGSNWNIGAD